MSDCKNYYLIKQIINLINCGSKLFIFVHISGLKEKESLGLFFVTLGCI